MKTYIVEVVPRKGSLLAADKSAVVTFEQEAHSKEDCRSIVMYDTRVEKVVSIKMKKKGS